MMRQAVTRRHVLKMGLASLGVAAGSLALRSGSAFAQDPEDLILWFRPTADLNLRSGASLASSVLAVIPYNSLIQGTGEVSNGFRRVTYNGITGWASDEYLSISNGPSPGPGGPDPLPTGEAHTNAASNLRSGPGLDQPVVLVVPFGALVATTDIVQNGYRQVVYIDTRGWIFDELLDPIVDPGEPGAPKPANGTVTTPLNLRSGPSLASEVLTVMPEGARVYMGDVVENGYREVQYMGINGWAADIYLRFDFDPEPPPIYEANGSTSVDLNLRSGSSLGSSVITVMPAGARLYISDTIENGFRAVQYMGIDGWAAAEYLDIDGAPINRVVVTAPLNLRQEPYLDAPVLLVMPEGSFVVVTGANQNGFLPVTYHGTFGWAWEEYLTLR